MVSADQISHKEEHFPKNQSMSEHEQLQKAIAALEAKKETLGIEVAEIALSALREKLATLEGRREPQQRKQVTVLFADVSGFTAMAETMDHEEVSGVINSLWSRVDKAILDQRGRIDKHIGDAVMALFGTPIAQEDDPERAIRAALKVQAEIAAWKKEFEDPQSNRPSRAQNIQLRIGINTGPALLGTVGSTGEYTAIGDTVNLASRLEHAAPLGGILISHDTYRHVRGIFEATRLEPLSVKGKSEPVQVYSVTGIRPRSFRVTTRGVEGIETRTVGRGPELEQMKAVFEEAASQQRTHLINIVAEAGLGKSRLLYEFGKWVEAQEHPILIFKGRATLEMTQLPYSLIRDILSNAFDIQDNDSASLARDKLALGIRKYVQDEEEAAKYTHFIGHLIGFDFSTSPHLQGILGDARQIRDRAFHFAAQFFAQTTRERTALIFLEDIHWSDSGSLDLLDHLMNARPDLPLLIVGLTRSNLLEQRPSWGTGSVQAVRLDVLPLSEENSRELVAEILRYVPIIPTALTDLIVQKAEGSPYYIEELIKILIESGVIMRGDTEWRVKMDRLAGLKVPATLTSLLQARLDSLPVEARQILQKASIVGRIFWTNVVESMQSPEPELSGSPVAVDDQLNALRRKELIYQYEDAAYSTMSEYIFKSMILHDVTYESVLLRLRRIYHFQVAEGLVRLSSERVDENAGRIGEHYECAGEFLKAAEWYARAGRQAQNTYAPETAMDYYQKALAFWGQAKETDSLARRLDLHLRLSEVLNWQARYNDAIENYRAMLKLAEENGDILAQSRAWQGLATSLGYQGDNRAALTYAMRAEELARRANASLELSRALWSQGSAKYRLGEGQAVLSLGEQALEIADQLKDNNERARMQNLLGAAHYLLGHYDQAQQYWESALSLFEELGNRQQVMDLLSNLGVIADARGDYAQAFERYDSALQIAREVGHRDGAIVFLTNRGGMQAALHNYRQADADLREAIRMAGITGSWIMPQTYIYHCEASLGLGDAEQALYSAEQALFLAVEDSAPEYIGMAWRSLGTVAMSTGKPIQFRERGADHPADYGPEACFRQSEKIFADTDMNGERARTLREWARYELKLGRREAGQEKWQEAREIFLELGADKEVERMAKLPA